MLNIKNLSYSLNHKALIQDIHLTFIPGHLYGILGPNGSGKSTLLKTLAGIWQPTTGHVFWQNQNLLSKPRQEISRILSVVPQNPTLHFDFTALELMMMGRYPHGLSKKDQFSQALVEQTLYQLDLWELKDRLVSQLSGGERQRVYIARSLLTEAPVLLLDEPTSCLDLKHQLEIWSLLQQLVSQGKIVVAALHDLGAVKRFCDQVVILNHGRCLAKGTPQEVLTEELLQKVFGVQIKYCEENELELTSCIP